MRLEIGFLEFAIAAGFLIRKFRRFTGWVAALTLLLFFPANIYAALNHIPMGGHEWGPDDLESVNPWRPRGIKIHGSTDFTTRQGYVGAGTYTRIEPKEKWSWGIEEPVIREEKQGDKVAGCPIVELPIKRNVQRI